MNAVVLTQPEIRNESTSIGAYQVASKAVEGLEKIVELNVQALKTSISEQQALVNAALSSPSLHQIVELQLQHFPAAITKTSAYWRHVGDITAETREELAGAVQNSVQSYLTTLYSLFESATSIAVAATGRREVTSPLVIDQPPAIPNESVEIVDSSGNVVSSSRGGANLH